MVKVFIFGAPKTSEETLKTLCQEILEVLSHGVGGKVVVFFLPDQMEWELGAEIAVEVKNFPDLHLVKQIEMAKRIWGLVQKNFLESFVDCEIYPIPSSLEGPAHWDSDSGK